MVNALLCIFLSDPDQRCRVRNAKKKGVEERVPEYWRLRPGTERGV
jgi:hypothetical protein